MHKLILITVLLFANAAFATEVTYKKAGFSINILDSSPSISGSQPVQMFLPAVNGFAANVNVQLQPYSESLDDYRKLSLAQFSQFGLKVVSSSIKNNTLVFEYSGLMLGNHLYFYSKAVKKGDFVYLATATDLSSEWPNKSSQLKSIVNSLKLQ